jgi:hypothetical protein
MCKAAAGFDGTTPLGLTDLDEIIRAVYELTLEE